jgi:uncharacterized protein (DUF305 family)
VTSVLEPPRAGDAPPPVEDPGHPGDDPGDPGEPWWHSRWRLAVLGAALVFLGMAAAFAWSSRPDHPGARSVDVGFLQDMRVHHAQAVQLALAAVDRARDTHDPAVRRLAAGVLLDQQAEIGVMTAWLGRWGQPIGADSEPMAWMGMAGHPMPGQISDTDLAQLASWSGRQADVFFLQALRGHHEGGIHMAEYARDHAETAEVRAFARAMIGAQSEELRIVDTILRRLGAA